jgi:hypothetical protein
MSHFKRYAKMDITNVRTHQQHRIACVTIFLIHLGLGG